MNTAKSGNIPETYEFPLYLFYQGKNSEAYKFFGVHSAENNNSKCHCFRVWAPNAKNVSVVGDFNKWDRNANYMEKIADGVWETFISGLSQFDSYKYCIETPKGKFLLKSDPYAHHFETRPGTASKIYECSYKWTDEKWISEKSKRIIYKSPVNIYEVHLGSWMHDDNDNPLSYVSFAEKIIPYMKKMSYTHIELMPLTEFPFDGSWGYQVTGYFAPTSRFGTPDDFKLMVDMFHNAGLGIIIDWVPAHFPKDACGLYEFDGTCCYEYTDERKSEHKSWGTRVFDYGKGEVCSFLISSANYWISEFHIDGIRVDAVASMLYLDYGKKDGEWIANKYGGNQNLEAIEFFKHLNTVVLGRNHGTVMIAEESTAWPMVTGDAEKDGLGFSLKWNMGWMNDFLEYMKLDPYFRKFNHNKMTFSMSYAYSERYVLVLSHDEVVHLKCSMIEKMPGELPDKFRNLKAAYSFMNCHPGKKLLFMGQEFGQLREWSEERELDWFLLNEEPHKELQNYVHDLLTIYKKYPALYAGDNNPEGFEWINADDGDRSIFSFVRKSPTKRNNILYIVNFTPVDRPDYRVGVPKKKQYKLIMDENGLLEQPKTFKAVKQECDNREFSFAYPLPAYGVAIFTY